MLQIEFNRNYFSVKRVLSVFQRINPFILSSEFHIAIIQPFRLQQASQITKQVLIKQNVLTDYLQIYLFIRKKLKLNPLRVLSNGKIEILQHLCTILKNYYTHVSKTRIFLNQKRTQINLRPVTYLKLMVEGKIIMKKWLQNLFLNKFYAVFTKVWLIINGLNLRKVRVFIRFSVNFWTAVAFCQLIYISKCKHLSIFPLWEVVGLEIKMKQALSEPHINIKSSHYLASCAETMCDEHTMFLSQKHVCFDHTNQQKASSFDESGASSNKIVFVINNSKIPILVKDVHQVTLLIKADNDRFSDWEIPLILYDFLTHLKPNKRICKGIARNE
ncbi:hypothetical protein EGR_01990 [Echinococcus granulosus]|uniref:Uncharacterized protein n=1 Tax=Echinococcus granulosus TaxID=6210 RepID=W6UR85_ECHGR|nr:hypothetical protein EGR_01990 [Echinococcus granulosus]EUB63186.1 hypothetical protein EGR_01990 [Echinococcus granulosus]